MINCVYRFLNSENDIIYIGKAKDLKSRILAHHHLGEDCYKEVSKIQYTPMYTMDETDILERYLVAKIKPKYNVDFKNRTIIMNISDFDNLSWFDFKEEEKSAYTKDTEVYENFLICNDINFHEKLSDVDVIRFIILSTNLSTKDNYVRVNSRKVTKSKLKGIFDTSNSVESKKTYNNLLNCGYILLDNDGYIKINEEIFVRGNRKHILTDDLFMLNIDCVIELYNRIDKAQRKFLSTPIRLFGMINVMHNIVTLNTHESDIENINPMNMTKISDMFFKEGNGFRLKKKMDNILIGDNSIIYKKEIQNKSALIVNENLIKSIKCLK